MSGGGPQGGTAGGILEYLSQSAGNLSFLTEYEGFKFIDDASMVELINLLLAGLACINPKVQVPSDMAVESSFLTPENSKTQTYLNTINEWTEVKEMKLNSSKTKYMIFNFCKSSNFQTRLYVQNNLFEQVRETKLLGVIITDDLKWHKNTKSLVKRANQRMIILHNLVNFNVPKEDSLQIYKLYIRSILEQSCVVWGTAITEGESSALERIQKCALYVIYQNEYISYTNALEISGLQVLSERKLKLIKSFAYKCVKNDNTKSMFSTHQNVQNTRNPDVFQTDFAYHERFKNSAKVVMT